MYVLRWREGVGAAECLLEMMGMVVGLLRTGDGELGKLVRWPGRKNAASGLVVG